MNGDRDGLNHGRFGKAQRVRQAVKNARRHRNQFGKGSVAAELAAGDAQHLAVIAKIDFAARAEIALAAGDGGIERHPVAGRPALHIRAHLFDHAGRFVAHHDGRDAAAGGAVESMHVGTADPTGLHADQHVVSGDRRFRHLLITELHVLFEQ